MALYVTIAKKRWNFGELFKLWCEIRLRKVLKMAETFGERLRKIRKQKKLPQWKLAKKIGISQQCLCRYECGEIIPTLTIFEWICIALGVTATELLGF